MCDFENDKICVIEYMDGEVERIECANAYVGYKFFGSTTTLEISITGKDDIVKSLSTIKRWRLDSNMKLKMKGKNK